MTTRHAGYVVTLAEDVREDDDVVLLAIRMIKGVISVRPIDGGTMDQIIAQSRVDTQWRQRILNLLNQSKETE